MMKIAEHPILFSQEELLLTNQRAVFWKRKKTLILSDLHLGKAAHFRKNGIALPTEITLQDLDRLQQLINHYSAEQVIIVGDLIHAGANKEVDLLVGFTQQLPGTAFILIKGNHDRMREDRLRAIGITEIHDSLTLDTIHFIHHNCEGKEGFIICGHYHPGVSLPLPTKRWMRFPCYVVSQRQLILPAFSRFTGLDTVSLSEKAVYYALYEEGIFKVE